MTGGNCVVTAFMRAALVVVLAACAGAEHLTPPPVVASVRVASGDAQRGIAGGALAAPVTIEVSNTDGSSAVGVSVRWSSDAGTVVGDSITDLHGSARATWTLGGHAGPQHMTVEAGAVASASVTATALPGPPATVYPVSGDAQSATVGNPLAAPIVVRVTDRFDNTVPAARVVWSDSGAGSLVADSLTDSIGVAIARWTLPTRSGTYLLTVAAGAGAARLRATARADVPMQVAVVSGDGGAGPYGVVLAQPVVARVLDRYGNSVPGTPVSFSATSGAPLANSGTTDSLGIVSMRVRLPASIGTLIVSATAGTATPARFTLSSHAPIFARLYAATLSTCALTGEGYAYCWGDNDGYMLGIGNDLAPSFFPQPVAVRTSKTFSSLSIGAHDACGIATDATLWCWGNLGAADPSAEPAADGVPYPLAPEVRFTAVAVGEYHHCALATTGVPWCWGENATGQSEPAVFGYLSPTAIAGAPKLTSITAGSDFTCGLDESGHPWCWGSDTHGQVGIVNAPGSCSSGPCTRTPAAVNTDVRFVSIQSGMDHTCGLTTAGQAYCWGANGFGQLGNGTDVDSPTPTAVARNGPYASLSSYWQTTCALTSSGAARCWGLNTAELGLREDGRCPLPGHPDWLFRCQTTPVETSWPPFVSLADGFGHVCAIDRTGITYCLGYNYGGQLGDGTGLNRSQPVKVLGQP